MMHPALLQPYIHARLQSWEKKRECKVATHACAGLQHHARPGHAAALASHAMGPSDESMKFRIDSFNSNDNDLRVRGGTQLQRVRANLHQLLQVAPWLKYMLNNQPPGYLDAGQMRARRPRSPLCDLSNHVRHTAAEKS